MKVFKVFFLLCGIFYFPYSLADIASFQKGVMLTSENISQIASTSVPYAVASSGIEESGDNELMAFLESSDKKLWALSRSNKIHLSDMESEDHLGNWPLVASDPCADSDDPRCISPEWVGRWSDQEFLEPEVKHLAVMYPMPISNVGQNVGCLNDNPLRYGDIENDETKELVITLNDNFIVFNANKKIVSFMSLMSVNDWETAENTKELYAENTSDVDPQYVSLNQISTAVTSKITSLDKEPGMRGYAKQYFGSFSAGDVNEILVWRKLYRSLLEKDPRRGFEKISDSYIHYKLIDGVYKKQPTEQAVVKGWLADKNLTWQKGYPSKSECSGQEGQLIPEMHDPLLNDPDVLK